MSAKTNKTDSLEKQVEAAVEAGLIPPETVGGQAKKTRGRPKTKSVEPPAQRLLPEEAKIENEKKLQNIINNAQKRRLIQQLKAFSVYFPEVCSESMNSLILDELTVDQLQRLYTTLEDCVLGYSEITSIPVTIKKVLGNAETTLVGIGASNPAHPVLGELLKLNGLSEGIDRDPEIDRNVKLISVKLAGRLPRNPYVNILTGIVRVAFEVYKQNSFQRPLPEVDIDPRYSKISNANK